MFCSQCGKELPDNAAFCGNCGNQLTTRAPQAAPLAAPVAAETAVAQTGAALDASIPQNAQVIEPGQTPATVYPGTNVIVNQQTVQKNGVGTAGFTLALIGIFTSWVPVLGWIVWLLGAILSLVGLARLPRGLAIAGTVISFIDVIVLVAVVGSIGGCAALSGF